ncbi:hypothetical protein [Fictibacillus barbaricus]|uniref:DUF2627 domain-containing protein n=1 Tax=Fictibacillus barbaricus TaxID=182136 RepID=A0ABS2Z7W6_9BACL|nr:hypothetical protein [Fictibacillus barbaricus]MBN3544133.1 hypothetical protein [Fictibacillus barbaricus]GGB69186.1 hypothetical protein GCM10007199_39240 [Fictibacillus barbaricus]
MDNLIVIFLSRMIVSLGILALYGVVGWSVAWMLNVLNFKVNPLTFTLAGLGIGLLNILIALLEIAWTKYKIKKELEDFSDL